MKVMKVIGLLIVSLLFLSASAQEPARCGTDLIIEKQLQDPKFARNFNSVKKLKHSVKQKANSTETLTIPVVVHVFHDGDDYGTGSNIADEVIYDAIANLNACFAGEPWHTTTHSGVTHPYSDSNIEFCLASIDPNGNPTNGITRQNPDTIVGYTQNGMTTTSLLAETHEHNLKELCYWPIQDYCNIYVLHKLNGGYSPLGFAYLPPNSSFYDGIVCQYQVFGFGEPWLLNNFNKNGTLVHEMGHYLGLLHTFQSTNSCNPISPITGEPYNCLTQGDMLCDTPPTTGSVGCSPISCPETMVENFMDYSSDYCMDRFSPDGVTRMRSELLQWRASLLDEDNLACGIPGGLDVKISNIIVPNVGCDPVMSSANYEIRNLGSDTLTETTINYYVNDQIGSLIWTGNLGFGEAEIVTIPDFNVGFGPVSITVEAVPIGDINNENDVATFEYNNYEGSYVDIIVEWDALPYGVDIELFEADSSNNPIGEAIFLYENEDNNLSCTVDTFDFCLPEGNYIVEVNDLFGNGMHYPCQFVDRCIWVEMNGESTGDSLCGGWSNGDVIPFTVGPPGCPPNNCLWDLNNDGVVGAADLNIILGYFGQTVEECSPYDFDEDGIVGVNDILDLISIFGYNCTNNLIEDSLDKDTIDYTLRQAGQKITHSELYDTQGKRVNDNGRLPEGIYIVRQYWDNGFTTTKKLFINSFN